MFLKEFGHSLIDKGYEIVPLKRGKKFPMVSGWQDIRATHDDVDRWLGNGHSDGGVGVLCRNTIAVDIDCLDAKVNYDLLHWLKMNVGDSVVRIGQKPKCILPFRVEGSFSKIRSAEYADAAGSKHAVEILADGQQFVAFGIHPSTKEPYRWVGGRSIADVSHADLPTINKDQAVAFVAYFEKLAEQQIGWELARVGASQTAAETDPDDLSWIRSKMEVSEQDVHEMLKSIDPDSHHDDWVKIGMALHHHYNGEDIGCDIWDQWSSSGVSYEEGHCARRYSTFASGTGKHSVTLASVKAMEKAVVSVQVAEERLPRMLSEWAFVHVEGSARVLREDLNKDNMVLYKLDDLKKEHMNCRVLSGDEKPKLLNLVDMWLEDPERRTYAAGLTFAPDIETLDRYNLWRGWSVESCEGDVHPWLDFVTDVIADGNATHANYIIGWAAQIIQKPMTKVGVGLVLRGGKGTGKTMFGELLGHLFAAHHMIVSRAEAVTGNFNRHLESTLLLQADEAYWAGAKSSEGALKDLLTNDRIQIERKGVDSYSAPNYTRVLFTSNENFVVPASLDERRFAVFDVGQSRQQDSEYFDGLDRWYKSGGASALIHYLRNFDLSNLNLRLVPQTMALQDQKLEALNNVNEWLLNCLQSGEMRQASVGGNVVQFGGVAQKPEIYAIYASTLRDNKFQQPMKEQTFWKQLKSYEGMFHSPSQREIAGVRARHITVNTLAASRFIFDSVNNLKINWSEIDAGAVDDDPFDPANWDKE
jgi:hypothetical protein